MSTMCFSRESIVFLWKVVTQDSSYQHCVRQKHVRVRLQEAKGYLVALTSGERPFQRRAKQDNVFLPDRQLRMQYFM
jgi:hypothetical protein